MNHKTTLLLLALVSCAQLARASHSAEQPGIPEEVEDEFASSGDSGVEVEFLSKHSSLDRMQLRYVESLANQRLVKLMHKPELQRSFAQVTFALVKKSAQADFLHDYFRLSDMFRNYLVDPCVYYNRELGPLIESIPDGSSSSPSLRKGQTCSQVCAYLIEHKESILKDMLAVSGMSA